VLSAIVKSGVSVEMPMVSGATPGHLAEIDQRMQRLSETLGVPIGPPGTEDGP
jgi:hypothetical protein